MSRIAAAFVLAALCLAPDDEGDLRRVIDTFFAAAMKKDGAAARAVWSEKSPHHDQVADWVTSIPDPVSDASSGAFAIDGDRALATVRFKGRIVSTDGGMPDESHNRWRVEFLREGGTWKWLAMAPAAAVFVRELSDAADAKARRELLKARPEEIGRRLLLELDKGCHVFLAQGNLEGTTRLLDAAEEAAELSGRDDLKGLAFLLRGTLLLTSSRPGAAVEPLRKAQQFAFKAGVFPLLAAVGARLGLALMEAGEPLQATIELAAARQLARESGDGELVGVVQNYCGKAEARRGEYERALEWHQLALTNAENFGDVDTVADALADIAQMKGQLGDYRGAREDAERGLKLLPPDPTGLRARMLSALGIAYLSTGRNREALKHLREALPIWEKLGIPRLLGLVQNNIGEAHRREGDYEEAEKHLRPALKILTDAGDLAAANIVRNNLGLIPLFQKRWKEAFDYFKTVLDETPADADPNIRCVYLTNMAIVKRELGETEAAIDLAREAARIADEKGTLPNRFQAHLAVGKMRMSRRAAGDLAAGVEELKKAATFLEGIRGGLRDPDLQQSFLADNAPFYHTMADALHELKRDPEAFAAAEEGKARTLSDLLAAGKVRITKAMTETEREEEQKLDQELQKMGRDLGSTFQTDARLVLEAKIAASRTALERFRREVYRNHPELPVLRGRSAPASLIDLNRRVLSGGGGTAVISYLVGNHGTLMFVVLPGTPGPMLGVAEIEIPLAVLQQQVTDFWSACSREDGNYKPGARALYKALLGPAVASLGDGRPVVIIPDGPLHALPFHALEDAEGVPLAETRAVSYAPSATALLQMTDLAERRRADPGKDLDALLAVGAPRLSPDFGALPQSKPEIELLARRYGVHPLVDADASETTVKCSLEHARRIHISTHGKADEESPLYSYLVLTEDEKNDGKLHAQEIVDLDIRADLVVLSACETARGEQVRGEGIVGLTWALFAAGAPATVVSQWQVSDQGTAELMQFFHEELKPGVSFAQALREAQKRLRKKPERSHPYYWAPFIVVGAGRG